MVAGEVKSRFLTGLSAQFGMTSANSEEVGLRGPFDFPLSVARGFGKRALATEAPLLHRCACAGGGASILTKVNGNGQVCLSLMSVSSFARKDCRNRLSPHRHFGG
jgi:hypothetical protein